MNRDELLEVCFDVPAEDLPQGTAYEETDEEKANVLSHVDLFYRVVLVRHSSPPGPGVSSSSSSLRVAALANVCTDPAHRGNGYATRQVELAHAEARTHQSVAFAALFAGPEERPFYERIGYRPVEGGPDGFMVCPLRGEEWPAGSVDTGRKW